MSNADYVILRNSAQIVVFVYTVQVDFGVRIATIVVGATSFASVVVNAQTV